MFLTTQGASGSLDKENAGTPARTKMLAAQNTPASALKPVGLSTPGMQQCTPMRRPLTQVNQDLNRSTPRMLSKPLLTPRLQGTPQMQSKTPGKKSRTSRKSLATVESQPRQWRDNLHLIADDLASQIMKEELESVLQEIKMVGQLKKYSTTDTKVSESCQSSRNTPANFDMSKAGQETRPVNESRLEEPESEHLDGVLHVLSSQSQDLGQESSLVKQSLEVEEESIAADANGLQDTCSHHTDIAQPQEDVAKLSDVPLKQPELVSLLDPLNDWTFHSAVSLVTPVKVFHPTHKPAGGEDVCCQGIATATMMTPVRHKEMASDMTPVRYQEVSSEITPVRYQEMSSEMTPVGHREMASAMTPVRHTEMSSEMTPVGHKEMASEMTPVKYQEMSSEMTPVRHREMSSAMTPVKYQEMSSETTPVRHREMSSEMTPVGHKEMASEMTPVKYQEMSSEMTPVGHREMSSEMTPVRHREMSSEMTPVGHKEMASEMTPVKFQEMSSEMTPVGHREMSSAMTPVKYQEMSSEMTPVRHMEMASEMTPVRLTDTGTCAATPVSQSDGATYMTPVKHKEASSGTPIKMVDASVCLTPVTVINTGTCVTPIHQANACTETSRVELVEAGVTGTTIDFNDTGTLMTPVKHSDAASTCMTPVRVMDSSCGMTPHQMTNNSTSMTPVTVSEVETLTSPMAIPVFRWEAENPQNVDPASLLGHLETASISNQLLRREVQMWTQKHATIDQQLSKAREDLKKKHNLRREEEGKAVQMRSLAKASLEKDVEDLMSQIGEQMMQIGELQNKLDEKFTEIDAAHREKDECQEQYKKEINNLQEDLKTAYRQHQQQIAELEDEVKRNNYKPHYQRAQETIKALQIEVEAYSGLSDTMQKASKIQEEFGCLEEAFTNVMTLFKKTVEKKHIWQSEHKVMAAQIETNQQQVAEAQAQLLQAESDKIQYQADMRAAQQREQASQDVNQVLRLEIDTANASVADLKKQLHTVKLEALGFQEDFKKSAAQCKTLEEANIAAYLKEQALEASLATQGEQWKELAKKCQGLTGAKVDLENQLTLSQERKSVLQADLNLSRKTVEEQWEEIEAQTNELETLRPQIHQMTEKIKDLEDNTDFLEEERHALVDAAKEADDNLRVTTLELSRCKVALEESETARKQWEVAVEDISERLQETQSELDNTKAYAHWMLLNQASEMRDAAQGLDGIQQEMNTMMQQLKETLGLDLQKQEKEISPIKDSPSSSLNSTTSSSGASSIVASVLSALQIKGSSTPKENGSQTASPMSEEKFNQNVSDYEQQEMAMADSIRESIGSGTNIVIGQSNSSAFTSLRNSSNSGASSIKTPAKQSDSGFSQGGQERNTGPLLVDQVGQVGTLFGQILKGLVMEATSLQASLQELKEERNSLQKNSTKSRQNFDSELSLVQEQLRVSEGRERALQQELANTKAKLCDLEQNLQYGEQRMQMMAGNLARFSDQKYTIEKLKHDLEDLTAVRKAAETEKTALQQVLDNLLAKVNSDEGGHRGSEVYGAVIKENCKLKMEIEKLRLKVLERQQHYEALNTRANRQMKVLEGNWKKAEAEIYRLDEIFDRCKQLIQKVPPVEQEDPNLVSLREVFN